VRISASQFHAEILLAFLKSGRRNRHRTKRKALSDVSCDQNRFKIVEGASTVARFIMRFCHVTNSLDARPERFEKID
jgi:hypothetical protein